MRADASIPPVGRILSPMRWALATFAQRQSFYPLRIIRSLIALARPLGHRRDEPHPDDETFYNGRSPRRRMNRLLGMASVLFATVVVTSMLALSARAQAPAPPVPLPAPNGPSADPIDLFKE